MAAFSTQGSYPKYTVTQGLSLHVPLSRPRTVQGQYVKVSALEIKAGAHHAFHIQRLIGIIDHTNAPCDRIAVGKDAVRQDGAHVCHGINADDLQRFHLILLSKGGRKAFQFPLSAQYHVAYVNQRSGRMAILRSDF